MRITVLGWEEKHDVYVSADSKVIAEYEDRDDSRNILPPLWESEKYYCIILCDNKFDKWYPIYLKDQVQMDRFMAGGVNFEQPKIEGELNEKH